MESRLLVTTPTRRSLAALVVVLAAAATLVQGAPGAAPGFRLTLPAPSGPLAVGTTTLRYVDTSRVDRFAPTPRAREILVHLWYPAARGGTARTPYLAPKVAAVNAHELGLPTSVMANITVPAHTGAPALPGRRPVVVFSPGFSASTAFYTLLVEDLASHGYVVVTVDHTYEAPIVFPGGRLVAARLAAVGEGSRALAARFADFRFVLDRLPELDRRGTLAGRLSLARIAAVGHSMGGTTAASVLGVDPRVRVGVDIDGSLRSDQPAGGLTRPFMVERARGHNDEILHLTDYRRTRTGPFVLATFAHVQHQGFMDLMALVPQLERVLPAIRKSLPVGDADPNPAIAAQRAYLRAFLDTYLVGRPSALLTRTTPAFPNVQVAVQPAR
jgi:dienelactone hydrolase